VLNQNNGVLILSEEAGAAEEFGDAPMLVSPYDVYGTRIAIYDSLTMSLEEKQRRAQALANQVMENNIHHWFSKQIASAEEGIKL
jgi:trehalose-6-phosphate synthase